MREHCQLEFRRTTVHSEVAPSLIAQKDDGAVNIGTAIEQVDVRLADFDFAAILGSHPVAAHETCNSCVLAKVSADHLGRDGFVFALHDSQPLSVRKCRTFSSVTVPPS